MTDKKRRPVAGQTADQFSKAGELCHCGHLREVHDPCSICTCPFFRPAERVKRKRYATRPLPAEGD